MSNAVPFDEEKKVELFVVTYEDGSECVCDSMLGAQFRTIGSDSNKVRISKFVEQETRTVNDWLIKRDES